ncbi:unnamed protein product [Peronospora belbahrii]|uniref:Uncharacterized protein n=1 Tax=Peronospora belbahrii TaxID=622444 RepID=A0ABN8CN94_9STRA|nr:unnamed protein product [Peronospora belbahrii]
MATSTRLPCLRPMLFLRPAQRQENVGRKEKLPCRELLCRFAVSEKGWWQLFVLVMLPRGNESEARKNVATSYLLNLEQQTVNQATKE